MKNFQASKAHRWDKILIRMMKLWGNSYSIKTNIPINESMLVMGVFLDECKNKRLNAIHKRDSKNLIKNYRPISLSSVFRKVSERLIFNSLLNCFIQNKL